MPRTASAETLLRTFRTVTENGGVTFGSRERDPITQILLDASRRAEAVRRKHDRITWEEKEAAFAEMGFVPTEKQKEISMDEHQIRVMRAGRRSGKTVLASAEGVATMIKKPGSRGWVMGPYFDVTARCWEMVVKHIERLERLGMVGVEKRRDSSSSMYIQLDNGASVEGRSAETGDTNQGVGLDWLVMDEIAQIEPFVLMEVVFPAIIQQGGWALLIGTPIQEHWASEEARKEKIRSERTGEPSAWKEFIFESWLNTYEFPLGKDDPKIRQMRRTMDPHVFMEQVMARPQRSPTVVYQEFNEEIHGVRCKFNPEFPVYLVADPGGSNIYAVEAFQDYGNRIEVIDEFYESHKVAPEVINNLRQRVWWPSVQEVLIDDASPSDIKLWRMHPDVHFAVKRANKPGYIEDSIPLVKAWLRDPMLYNYLTEPLQARIVEERWPGKDWLDLDPEDHKEIEIALEEQLAENPDILMACAKIFFDNYRCPNVIKEMAGLHVKRPRKDEKNLPEVPVSYRDHGADCIRYYIFSKKRHYGAERAEPIEGERVA